MESQIPREPLGKAPHPASRKINAPARPVSLVAGRVPAARGFEDGSGPGRACRQRARPPGSPVSPGFVLAEASSSVALPSVRAGTRVDVAAVLPATRLHQGARRRLVFGFISLMEPRSCGSDSTGRWGAGGDPVFRTQSRGDGVVPRTPAPAARCRDCATPGVHVRVCAQASAPTAGPLGAHGLGKPALHPR